MSSTSTTFPSSLHTLHPVAEIEVALAYKEEQLRRACEIFLRPYQDANGIGPERHRKGWVARQIEGFAKQRKALKMELWKAKLLEKWLEEQWGCLEAAERYVGIVASILRALE